MAFMDKLKNVANKAMESAESITQATKGGYEKFKKENEEKKEQKELYLAEMNKKAEEYAFTMIHEIEANGEEHGIFSKMTEESLLAFTKDFYEKMVLPGSKASLSCITMHSYIEEKKIKAIQKHIPLFDTTELPILYIKEAEGQHFLFTQHSFYFKIAMPEDKKFYAQGKVESNRIDRIEIERSEEACIFKVNGIRLATIKIRDTYKQDFMALNQYFESIKRQDFDITQEEIDRLIHQKIGDKIYQHIKKYMTYEDELVMYYAGGLDSLLAMDYIACTTKQIIIVNREMLGATSNVKQFYYEDITSMATEQNSKADGFVWQAIDSALTAALKVCDLIIMVAGAKEKISTLYTIEAQRVVSIYHQYRKEAKKGNQSVQTIIQQKEPDIYEQLEKLKKLKDNGIISEEEFNQKKLVLLEKI